jgi:hypothetical protein
MTKMPEVRFRNSDDPPNTIHLLSHYHCSPTIPPSFLSAVDRQEDVRPTRQIVEFDGFVAPSPPRTSSADIGHFDHCLFYDPEGLAYPRTQALGDQMGGVRSKDSKRMG